MTNIAAGRAVLLATEQDVLFDAVEAYANVVRERVVLELNSSARSRQGTMLTSSAASCCPK